VAGGPRSRRNIASEDWKGFKKLGDEETPSKSYNQEKSEPKRREARKKKKKTT
jgi:hypothetical protein